MAKHRPSTAMLRPSSLIAAAALCLPLTSASQPGAASPVPAPMRDLTWGQLNFLHTTDTHGWLGGHLLEPQYSADWGDYVSFAEHMRRKADERGADLLVIDTGDRVEGNGLYDSSSPKGLFTYDIFREQAVDILCTGNHELYQADAAQREHDITVPNFRENYIASNLDYIDPKTGDRVPQAQRYRKFKTKNQGLEIVALGFLFDFTGNANNTVVQPVEDTIKSDWFKKMLEEEKPDLFVVIGHVGLRMPEFKAIFTAIRKGNWFAPIAFFGGHAHVRDALKFDKDAFALASGRYGETIGWMSIDNIKRAKSASATDEVSAEIAPSASFTRKYIDNNLFGLYHHTGLNETTFPTEYGKNVTKMIEKARKALDLDYKYGCAPKDLWVNRAPYPSDDSIFTWLETQVLPDVIHKKDRKDVPRLAIVNTGGIRFDIFKGAFTKDSTYIVSPFTSTFKYIPDVPYGVAKRVIELLNKAGKIFEATHDTRFMNIPEMLFPKDDMFMLKTEQEGEPRRLELRQETDQHPLSGDDDKSKKPDLIGGYTTKDDIGADGDDTEHVPIQFYEVPNCVQTEIGFPKEGEPEKVDVVFIDFILQWVLVALKFSGGDYSEEDVLTWSDDTLTYKMGEWIKENWKGDC
ncbi:calcineurin-like phosphoesterase [Colletotrichum navitas]|uniref:Calcineurin-like phosphoesterase n=1 Tax=Colletotrichum navitas TaxID=681940 RepID=A0AAD8V3K2_9PEZI|nr:calcineurin-like phosphoesterase [Colletotrichum navitas]KAK1590910.1 calcineurin-like phosphoesterase [Colletotrichum navitas]